MRIGLNERNMPVGQGHRRAKLSDKAVEEMRALHDDGYGYRKIARMLSLPLYTVRDIVNFRRRNVLPVAWIEVEVRA